MKMAEFYKSVLTMNALLLDNKLNRMTEQY